MGDRENAVLIAKEVEFRVKALSLHTHTHSIPTHPVQKLRNKPNKLFVC